MFIPLYIPTVHYIGEKMFELSERYPDKKILFLPDPTTPYEGVFVSNRRFALNDNGDDPAMDKLRFRLTVRVEPSKVKNQKDIWREQKVPKKMQRDYDPIGQAKFWFLHEGPIAPENIDWLRNGTGPNTSRLILKKSVPNKRNTKSLKQTASES